jgi:hypothetical protein
MMKIETYYNEINRLKSTVANSVKYRNVPVSVASKAYDNLIELYKEHEIDIVINSMIDYPANPQWDRLLLDLLENQGNDQYWREYADIEIRVLMNKI